MHKHLHNLGNWFSDLPPRSKILVLIAFLLFAGVSVTAISSLCARPAISLMEELHLGPLSKKQDGNTWVISLISGQPLGPIKESAFRPGPPITVSPDVRVMNRFLSIGLDAKGQAGEKYIPGVKKNGKWLGAPTFEVVDESGRVIGSGQFEYG